MEFCNGGNLYEYKSYYQKKNGCELNEFFCSKKHQTIHQWTRIYASEKYHPQRCQTRKHNA